MAFQSLSIRPLTKFVGYAVVLTLFAFSFLGFTPARLRFELRVNVIGDREQSIVALERVIVARGGIRDASPDGSESWYVVQSSSWGAPGQAFIRLVPQSTDAILVKVDLGPFRTGCSRPDGKKPAVAFLKSVVDQAVKASGIAMELDGMKGD